MYSRTSGFAVLALAALGAGMAHGEGLTHLELRQIRVGGELGQRIDATIHNNLMVLDADGEFLKPFQERTARDGYVGLGKLIDSAVRFAAYSGDAAVVERKRHLVDGIIALQEPDGYIGMFEPGSRMWSLWDIHEMSYLIYGLTSDFRYFQEERSLAAAQKAADYIITRWSAEPGREPGGGSITVYMAVTGIEAAMLALHDASHEQRYLDFCVNQRELAKWDGPIVLGRWGLIQGHAYAYMTRCLAQLRLYGLQPAPQLLVPTRRALDFMTRENGLAITGTCGQHECWHNTQEGAANLGETCATAYLIRLLDELMRMEGKPEYGDLMERAVYNSLLAAQSPDGRHIRYYTPQEGPRVYFDKDTYCCPCNFRRILAELPEMIYYRTEDGIAVNLFVPSSAEASIGVVPVRIAQETSYPSDGDISIQVQPERPARFTVRLRIPAWCAGASAQVNGEAATETAEPGAYLSLEREWHPGDAIRLSLPMELRLVKGREAQAGKAAVMYGPRVFCLNRGKNAGLEKEDLHLITINPDTLEGPIPDDTVRPGGLACKVRAWRTTNWYPQAPEDWTLTLTEFPDPDGEATYFHVPNPLDGRLKEDELTTPR